jgi:hypothetical protein
MKHAEKKCCQIKSGCIPFSSKALLWICQCQVYCYLLRWHAGKIQNWGNLKQTSWKCQIDSPFFLSVEEVKLQLAFCKQKSNYFQKHGKRHCRQHLNQGLVAAKDRADEEAGLKILAIIR